MEILESNRGGVKLGYEGHLYVRKRTLNDGRIRWQCDQQRSAHCSGAVTTNGPPAYGNPEGQVDHNHNPSPTRAGVLQVRRGIKRTARDVNSGPSVQVIANQLLAAEQVRQNIGPLSTLTRDVQRQRFLSLFT